MTTTHSKHLEQVREALEKKCNRCGVTQPIDQFYRNSGMADGRKNQCRTCCLREIKEYNHKRNRTALQREWRNTPQGRAFKTAAGRRYREQHREKFLAQKRVVNAINSGRLLRGPCVVCGATENIHAHHEDYSKPYDVTWLCPAHHSQRHVELRRQSDATAKFQGEKE